MLNRKLRLKQRTKRLTSNRFRRIRQIYQRKCRIAERQRVGFMLMRG